jgi:hypothetical protein
MIPQKQKQEVRLNQPDMIPANPRHRNKVLILVILALVGMGLLLQLGQPWLKGFIESKSPEQSIQLIKWLLSGLALAPCGLAAYIASFAIRVYRQGMFPPEGARVLRDTPILYDRDARRRATILLMLSALLLLMANLMLLMAFFLPKLIIP